MFSHRNILINMHFIYCTSKKVPPLWKNFSLSLLCFIMKLVWIKKLKFISNVYQLNWSFVFNKRISMENFHFRRIHTNQRLSDNKILKFSDELKIAEMKIIWRWNKNEIPLGLKTIITEINERQLRNRQFRRDILWKKW